MYWIDITGPGRLAIAPAPPSGDGLARTVRTWRAAGIDQVISLLEAHEARSLGLPSEDRACADEGLLFHSFPVIDHGVPTSVDAVRTLCDAGAAALDAGQGLLIHCWAGIGRSSLLAACVMANRGVDPQDAFARISAARGATTPETRAQRAWVIAFVNA